MALSDDQRAMLRLLAERGEEGYEDIAALKGVGVDQVRAEMREAIAAAAAEQEPAEPAQPKPPKPRVEPPTPVEPPPTSPPPRPSPPTAAKPSPPPREPRRSASLPPERRRFALVAAAALALVAVVIALIALIGGTSGGSGSSAAESTGSASAEGAANGKLTQAELQPVSGQSGEGQAIFGKVGKAGKEEIVLQVAAQGLDPNQTGQSYTVWLYHSPKVALRIGSAKVGKPGRMGVQLPIPTELLAYVVSGAFDQIYLSRTSDAAYQSEVAQAKKQKKLPPYSGETVLTGEITGPIVRPTPGKGH
jgi:hypothetical protein